MTTSGAPSLLSGIRYFSSETKYLDLPCSAELNAFGKRLAFWLNSAGLSVGSFHHVYIVCLPGESGVRVAESWGGECWWFRHVYVGVPADFPTIADAFELGVAATRAALENLVPQATAKIEMAIDRAVRPAAQSRFTLLEKRSARRTYRASLSVFPHPASSRLYLSVDPDGNKPVREVFLAELAFPDDAFDLAGKIDAKDECITLSPKSSLRARSVAERQGAPFSTCLKAFAAQEEDVVTSGLIRKFGRAM